MAVDLTVLVITSLGGVVATLAGIIFRGQRKEIEALRKAVHDRDKIILSEAGKKDETIAAFARLWGAHGEAGGDDE